MLCDSVGLEPAPNNGTLRLPLKIVGTHKPEDTPEVPVDPVPTVESKSTTESTTESKKLARPTLHKDPFQPKRPTIPVVSSQPPKATVIKSSQPTNPSQSAVPSRDSKDGDSDTESDDDDNFWDWFTHKIEKVWHKVTGSKSDSESD